MPPADRFKYASCALPEARFARPLHYYPPADFAVAGSGEARSRAHERASGAGCERAQRAPGQGAPVRARAAHAPFARLRVAGAVHAKKKSW